MFNFSLKEVNPTLQALEDMKEEKKEEKVRPTCFFFLAAPYIFPDQGCNPYPHSILGTQSHNHWTVREIPHVLVSPSWFGKGESWLSGTIQVDVGQQGSWNIPGDTSKQEKPPR